MSALPDFCLHRPQRITDVVALLDENNVPYAGGTELLLAMRVGLLRPAGLIDLKGIPELRAITVEATSVRIGAGASHHEVETHPGIRQVLPAVARMAGRVGNPRVRSTGTVVGNVCFAEPKSDWLPVLVALDATITLQNPSGSRTTTVAEHLQGPYWTDRAEDELAVHLDIPLQSGRVLHYLKFQTMERPTLGVAAVGWRGSPRRRVVVGAAVELPHRVDAADGSSLDAEEIAADLDVVADLTGAADYKRHVAAVHIRRALAALEEELGA